MQETVPLGDETSGSELEEPLELGLWTPCRCQIILTRPWMQMDPKSQKGQYTEKAGHSIKNARQKIWSKNRVKRFKLTRLVNFLFSILEC